MDRELDNKINGWKITTETIEKLHSWFCNHTLVVYSPLTNDHVNI